MSSDMLVRIVCVVLVIVAVLLAVWGIRTVCELVKNHKKEGE